jgi:hypothetical protein
MEITRLDVKPEVYLVYDGLGGLSRRPMIRDIMNELQYAGPEQWDPFVSALRRRHAAHVFVYFNDYVSYGIGGGDATAEFFYGSFLILHRLTEKGAEELTLTGKHGTERHTLDAAGK